jgi:pilus assembly protein CpaC
MKILAPALLFIVSLATAALGGRDLHAESSEQTAVILPLAPAAPPASALEAPLPSPLPTATATAAPAVAAPDVSATPDAAWAAKSQQAVGPLPSVTVPLRSVPAVPEDPQDTAKKPSRPEPSPTYGQAAPVPASPTAAAETAPKSASAIAPASAARHPPAASAATFVASGPAMTVNAEPAVLRSSGLKAPLDSNDASGDIPVAIAFHAPLIAPPTPLAAASVMPPQAPVSPQPATPVAIAPGAASPPVAAPAGTQQLALALNKSLMIRLVRPARDVLVANPAIADVVLRSADTVFVVGRKVGETNVYFFDAAGQQIDQIDVRVDFDSGAVEAALKHAIPSEKIDVSTANQSVVLMGTVASPIASENARQIARQFVADDKSIINLLKIRGQNQVLLRVRVAEMSRQIVKELGISPTAIFNAGTSSFNLAGAAQNFTNAPFAALTATTPLGAASRLSGLIQALESNGLVKTLAEPNLTAVSGEPASFLVGGEFPVPVPQQGTGNSTVITVDYKEFGIRLTFTPVVLSPTVISLRISTEVSQLSTQGQVNFGGFVIPALSVRRAETTVELPSGGSIAIAGLLQNDIQNTIQGLPGLKDIPILGALFASTQFQRNESDLVIAVTPLLVRPVDPNTLAFPTDGFGPASDFDMYLLGRLHAEYTKPEAGQPHGQPKGPFGFIME